MEKLIVLEETENLSNQLRCGLGRDYDVVPARSCQEAMSLFLRHSPKVVTLDLGTSSATPGTEEGFRCLEEMLRLAPSTKVIMVTDSEEREHALRAVRSGAFDYYCKPLNVEELKVMLRRAFRLADLERQNLGSSCHNPSDSADGPGGIIGQSPGMLEVFSSIRRVATSDVAVLITGESGTGKELVAKAIHCLGPRKAGSFIAINCGAIPTNLLESELFGYEKGAFSGAHSRVQGKVEFAHRGTLFLDEIGELPLNLQVKLLRFLQEKNIQRVGGREDIAVNARIIAATNRDIARDRETGTFREDLYYRISVIHINLPPLRERGGDIMLLANFFLKRFSTEFRKKARRFSSEAIRLLESYDWPGNVRELENKVQRAVIMSDAAVLEPEALDFSRKSVKERFFASARLTLRDAREMVEREMVAAAIRRQRHNMARAAEALGISRPTLYDLVKKYGILKQLEQELS